MRSDNPLVCPTVTVSAESMGSQTISNEVISERTETWEYGDKRKEEVDLVLNKSSVGAELKHIRPNILVRCGGEVAVWCDGEYINVHLNRASLLAAAGDGDERGVAGHGVREVDATMNIVDEANLGAVWKSAASGGGDNVRAELDGVEGREEREAPYAPNEQNQAGKEIGGGAENCSNSTAEKNIPPSVVNEIHASLDESGKQHVGICLMRGNAVQDSDLEDENTVVQEIGLDDERAIRNLEYSEDPEQDAD
ncbi:hypothetical protein S245_016341, partial [Arachis hypogaea]